MRHPAVLLITVLGCALGSAQLTAQSAEVRRELSTFDQQLTTLTDSAEVHRLERGLAERGGAD